MDETTGVSSNSNQVKKRSSGVMASPTHFTSGLKRWHGQDHTKQQRRHSDGTFLRQPTHLSGLSLASESSNHNNVLLSTDINQSRHHHSVHANHYPFPSDISLSSLLDFEMDYERPTQKDGRSRFGRRSRNNGQVTRHSTLSVQRNADDFSHGAQPAKENGSLRSNYDLFSRSFMNTDFAAGGRVENADYVPAMLFNTNNAHSSAFNFPNIQQGIPEAKYRGDSLNDVIAQQENDNLTFTPMYYSESNGTKAEMNHASSFDSCNNGKKVKKLARLSSEETEESDDSVRKGSWTKEEDEMLLKLSDLAETKNWTEVAEKIPGRSAKQCRERWCYNLSPSIAKVPWSQQEDRIIIEKQKILGNKWAKIAQHLEGRTENAVKTRYKSIIRAMKREWSPEEDTYLIKMYESVGTNWGEISRAIQENRSLGSDRSKNAVKTRFKELEAGILQSNKLVKAGSANETIRELYYPQNLMKTISDNYRQTIHKINLKNENGSGDANETAGDVDLAESNGTESKEVMKEEFEYPAKTTVFHQTMDDPLLLPLPGTSSMHGTPTSFLNDGGFGDIFSYFCQDADFERDSQYSGTVAGAN